MTKTLVKPNAMITGAAVALVVRSYGSVATPLHPVGVFTGSGMSAVSGNSFGDQAYFWTKEWQHEEAQVDYEYLVGNTYRPTDVEDLIRSLRED